MTEGISVAGQTWVPAALAKMVKVKPAAKNQAAADLVNEKSSGCPAEAEPEPVKCRKQAMSLGIDFLISADAQQLPEIRIKLEARK